MTRLNRQLCTPLTDQKWAADRGASIVQFCLVVPILMLITIAIVDLCRLLTIETILNKGAEDGLNLATKLSNIDNDITGMQPSDADYLFYNEARRRVILQATRIALTTFLTDENTPSAAKLLPMTVVDEQLDTSLVAAPVWTRGAALLRPGERAWAGDPLAVGDLTKGQWVQHSKVAYSSPPPPQRTEMLLKYQPLQVEIRAEVQMLLPYLGKKVVRGSALGYREPNIPKSPLAPLPGDLPIVTPFPTATPQPTPTATPRVTPTPPVWDCAPSWLSNSFNTSVSGFPNCPYPGSGVGIPCTSNLCGQTGGISQ